MKHVTTKWAENITLQSAKLTKPLWRNRPARSAVNRKIGGSSPPRGAQQKLNGIMRGNLISSSPVSRGFLEFSSSFASFWLL